MACVPGTRRHLSSSSQFLAALSRPSWAFIEAGEVSEHLYLEGPQKRLNDQGFQLRLATCCAMIARLFAPFVFVGLMVSCYCHLTATAGPRQV
jgi:hypothetical protein